MIFPKKCLKINRKFIILKNKYKNFKNQLKLNNRKFNKQKMTKII